MTLFRPAAALICVGIAAGLAQAEKAEILLQPGSYEVDVSLELPHVEAWAGTTRATICVPHAGDATGAPLPVLSGNNPLARCPASNVRRDGAALSFEVVCEGRNGARGLAVYELMPRSFRGRIAMTMGGKNMTMTEVQLGRRVGPCDAAGAPSG